MLVVRTEWQDNPRPIDYGTMVVAIGDVHGCSKHLELMYESIADDIAVSYTHLTLPTKRIV